MTKETQKSETVNNDAKKPIGTGFIPVKGENGKTQWIEAGPIWPQKEGDGQILEIVSLPVQFFSEGLPSSFRIVLQPHKD